MTIADAATIVLKESGEPMNINDLEDEYKKFLKKWQPPKWWKLKELRLIRNKLREFVFFLMNWG